MNNTLRHRFADAAATYDESAVLAHEVGRRMAARLDWVKLAPQRIADIGCASGAGIRALQTRYPDAWPLAIDSARPMLAAVAAKSGWFERLRGKAPRLLNADVCALPCRDASLDLGWSNLMLHWLAPDDLRRAFAELRRVLTIGGLLHFSLLGPDTLKSLRQAGAPVARFPDMHDIGDLLVQAGFTDPVMEMEMLTLTYRSPRAFLADQRRLGVRDALLGRLDWPQWRRVLAAWPQQGDVLPAEFEVIYGHAWKTAASPTTPPVDTPQVIHWQRRR